LEILYAVAQKFKKTTAKKIVELSHREEAWLQNHEKRSEISYDYTFGMGGI
jgi:uncharacterized phage-associated protein